MKRTLAAALLLALPLLATTPVSAQATDTAYCASLSDLARRYLVGDGGRGRNPPNPTINLAIANCSGGDTASGIPVLEQRLLDNGFSLPKR